MFSTGWTSACLAEVGGRILLHGFRTRENPWVPLSKFSPNIVATSGGGREAKRKPSGDFAGLSALKEQLESQDQGGSGSRGFAGLSSLKERMTFEKRATPAPLSLERKKAANDSSLGEKGQGHVALMVSNLPKDLTKAEYESFMQQIPEIASCTFLTCKSGGCRGYGFCETRPGADVAAVVGFISSQTLGGRALKAFLATGKKVSEEDQQDVTPKSGRKVPQAGAGVSNQEKARPRSSLTDAKRKPAAKHLSTTVQLRNESRAVPDAQPQLSTVTSSHATGYGTNSRDSSKLHSDDGSEPRQSQQQSSKDTTTIPEEDGRLSGSSILAALERMATAGRARQRRAKRIAPRSASSEFEDELESTNDQQFIEFKSDWAERIQLLEASIEELKRS